MEKLSGDTVGQFARQLLATMGAAFHLRISRTVKISTVKAPTASFTMGEGRGGREGREEKRPTWTKLSEWKLSRPKNVSPGFFKFLSMDPLDEMVDEEEDARNLDDEWNCKFFLAAYWTARRTGSKNCCADLSRVVLLTFFLLTLFSSVTTYSVGNICREQFMEFVRYKTEK